MRVLFVSSGNSKAGISPIVKAQGESLIKEKIELDYFTIKGRGVRGYLNSVLRLRELLKRESYEIIHAHYWLSGIVATLAGAKNLVVSLMGDDVKANAVFRWIIRFFYYISWDSIIVKSQDMYHSLNIKDAHIISNGVDMERFRPIDKEVALNRVGWDKTKKHILFTSNPDRKVKNFELAKRAFDYLDNRDLELHYLKGVPQEEVVYYYNASDVVLLTSLWEGSPNAIKEAMACNIPIVSVDVGDVRELISNTKGCYITTFDYRDIASKIKEALSFKRRTKGKEAISHLKSENVAKKIIDIYQNIKRGKK
jgi:glycosyltransferase involved in cell wall biosynthesis